MLDLIAVGDVMLDVLGPAGGGTPIHAPLSVVAGGSAVNVAIQAVKTGHSAAVVGRVGDDAAGRIVADELRRAGVEVRLSVDPDRRTGCVASLGGLIVADRGANAGLRPADVVPLRARVVVVSGYLLLHEDSQPAALAALAAASLEPATLTCVDLGAAGLVRRAHDLERLLRDADVVVGDAAAVEAAGGLEVLAERRRAAAATLGSEGALGAAGTERARAEPPHRLPVSPWGAGDAFVASFALGLARGAPLPDALVEACAAGTAH